MSSSPHGPVPRQLARVLANLPEQVRVTWADHQLHGAELPVHGWHRIQGEVHLLVEEAAEAFTALTAAGIHIALEQEVAVVPVEDRPGVLGDVSRRLGDAGVNVTLAYLATSTRLVFAADNLAEARATLD